MVNRERYSFIDASRLILAFLVVCIHYPFSFSGSSAIKVFARIAVPIFFMISGFFMYNKDYKLVKTRIKKSIPKILIFALLASTLYIAIDFAINYANQGVESAVVYLRNLLNLKSILKLLILNVPLAGVHLWYIFAHLYVLILYYFGVSLIYKHKSFFATISILLLIAFAGYDTYAELFFKDMFSVVGNMNMHLELVRNVYFDGFPYFTIGFLLRDSRIRQFYKNKPVILILYAILFYALSMIEYKVIGRSADMSIGIIGLSVSVFLILITNKHVFANTSLPRIGKQYSRYIYVSHLAVGKLLVLFIDNTIMIPYISSIFILLQPIVIFLISFLISIMYVSSKTHLINFFKH